ncbi:uncharacterized protein LOC113342365 isoform X3 [Papaver somniferum]|uniref:uncharacterized protein LOC113342365 isoform X3 n=1 Tax=Papaver somniferum TaxID=3469 RepID=UPI000E6FD60F|nr:uncharacterized protein LOC113342365 isoform X3 [Papaver somniferum]
MIRALRKFGGSASVYSPHSPSANPIPKPNPSLSPTHSSSSSVLLNRVRHSRVYRTEQYVHPNYFYCDMEDFKEMLIGYKSGNRKMYPYIFEALTARFSEHAQEDKKLMNELGVLSRGGDKKEVHRENCARRDEGEGKEVESTTGFMEKERVWDYPPNPYGMSGYDFFSFGRTGGEVTDALGKPGHYLW